MNPRPARLSAWIACVAFVAFVAFVACVACAACSHRQKADWRVPGPGVAPTPCASDADCNGGTCGIEMGASQGTCSGPPSGDGGAQPGVPGTPPHSPGTPVIQPSSSDIQI